MKGREGMIEMGDRGPTSHDVDESRPAALSFPLGIALLIIVIFCLSCFFSCFYHWDKLRALRYALISSRFRFETDHTIHSPSKSTPPHPRSKQDEGQSLPVIMAGDKIPRYMAWPCPCPRLQHPVEVQVQVPPLRL